MAGKLPDAHDRITRTGRKALLQRMGTPLVVLVSVVILIICGTIGVVHFFQSLKQDTVVVVVATEPELSKETVTSQATVESSLEPTKEGTIEPTDEPTIEPIAEPTIESTEETTLEQTQEATAEPTQETAPEQTQEATIEPTEQPVTDPTDDQVIESATTPVDSTTSGINLAELPGKIAVPAFNLQTNTYDLYIANAPDWQPQLFQQGASQPAFSPDGTQIVFRSWGGGDQITSYGERLVIRSVLGSGERLITLHFEDARPQWRNFDFPILFHSRPSGQSARIYLQALWQESPEDSHSRRELVIGEYPAWLADGRIVYASGEPQGIGLYVMNSDGSNIQKVWSNMVAPKGSPINNQVIFSYNDDLYRLTITDPNTPEHLTDTPARERLPSWSPDGQFIAYVKDQGDNQWAVYVMRVDGSNEIKLFDIPGSIDGKPFNVPADKTFGWLEEQLAWGP